MSMKFLNTIAVDNDVLYVDTTNDRVGIGTTSPAHSLSVNGTVSSNFFRGYTYPDNSFLDFDKDDTAASNYTALASIGRIAYLADTNANSPVANAAHEFFTGTSDVDTATSLMIIDSSGNVGIGTTSPATKLDVNGEIGASGDGYLINGMGFAIESSGVLSLGDWDGNDFQTRIMDENASEVLRVVDGKVGIGTTTPSEKLDVDGNVKIKDVLLSNQENTDIDSAAAEVVAQVAHATYTAAFFDFVVKKGTNVRSGTVYACHDGDTTPLVEFTETSTNDLGDTSDVTLSVDISGANMRLLATVTSDDWSVKSLIRAI